MEDISVEVVLIGTSFDLYLDPNYPTTPPKMQFTSEGNDDELETFNPNFHRGGNGKYYQYVQLLLLG
jgi:hypothetical protein